jgi:hypothetical protein
MYAHSVLMYCCCCCCLFPAVCPGGGGSGPDCDQCPQNMVLMSNGICESESAVAHQQVSSRGSTASVGWWSQVLRVQGTKSSACSCSNSSGAVFAVGPDVVHAAAVSVFAGGCAPGTGGTTCNMCLPGFYSSGGKPDNPRPVCKPCGLHFTSPAGAISAAYCECEAGFGSGYPGDPMSEFTCELCPIGTYNPGPGISERHIAAVDDYGGGGGYGKKKRLPRASPCRFVPLQEA